MFVYDAPQGLEDLFSIVLVGGLALMLAVYGFSRVRAALRARASEQWPTVQGKILTCAVRREVLGLGRDGIHFGGYAPVVRYAYSVDGVDYVGNRVTFGKLVFGDSALAERYCDTYERGQLIDIYYCPRKPELSVLRAG